MSHTPFLFGLDERPAAEIAQQLRDGRLDQDDLRAALAEVFDRLQKLDDLERRFAAIEQLAGIL